MSTTIPRDRLPRYQADPEERGYCLRCGYARRSHGIADACPNPAHGHPRAADLAALAMSFPSLTRAWGAQPFNPYHLAAWGQAEASSGALHCVRFMLTVWSGQAHLEPFEVGPFDAVRALQGWDNGNRAAFAAWARAPWWA